MVGKHLGPYQVLAKLGAGGMGEVYRARDTRLDRVVAIKVLPAATSADAEFRARFEREARAISQLNHPHICTLFDVGEADGVSFLVMEHLEGETLADRVAKGPLPIDRALEYAVEIADALDKAHRRGITHRDLKPANVMLTKAGTKLLDFGLAKIGVVQTPGSAETRLAPALVTGADAARLTSRGSLLGTFQYMAPEQLEGREVDSRADIWAFGCVLYEMVTGRRAFEGKTQASLIAAILEREPAPIDTLQREASPALSGVVRACLVKDPDDRFQTAHDLRLQLKWIQEDPAPVVSASVFAHGRWRNRLIWPIVTVAVAVVAGATIWRLKPSPIERHIVARLEYVLPEGQHFTRPNRHDIALSPDGTKLVYVANNQLYLRPLDQLDAQPIPGTNVDPLEPVFSPDSQSVAYFAPRPGGGGATTLRRIAVAGGTPQKLCETLDLPWGASWQNGQIAFGQNTRGGPEAAKVSAIQIVPENGGTPRTIVSVDANAERAAHPQLLDGKHVLFVVMPSGAADDEGQIVVQSLDGGQRRRLISGGTDPRVLPSGHLVYVHDFTLYASPFDPKTLTVSGGPVPIADGITQSLGNRFTGQFAISSSGVLAFLSKLGLSTLVWVDQQGQETNIPSATPRAYGWPRLSPNGTRIAFTSLDQGKHHIWVLDLAKKAPTPIQVTSGPTVENNLVWQDDDRIVFSSGVPPTPRALFRKAFDAIATPEPVTNTSVGLVISISPDKKYVVYQTGGRDESNDLMLLTLDGSGESRPLLADPNYNERNGEISPDGHWIAYESWEQPERPEVFVRPFPDVGNGRFQVSTNGGAKPVWDRSGQALFYIQRARDYALMRVAVHTGPTPTVGPPTRLFSVLPYDSGIAREFDVSPKGDRFLMVKQAGDSSARSSIVVVTNWLDELRARVPTGR